MRASTFHLIWIAGCALALVAVAMWIWSLGFGGAVPTTAEMWVCLADIAILAGVGMFQGRQLYGRLSTLEQWGKVLDERRNLLDRREKSINEREKTLIWWEQTLKSDARGRR